MSGTTTTKQQQKQQQQHHDGPRKVTVVVIGAGHRGKNYAQYALQYPHLLDVVGVAEPRQYTRQHFQHTHSLPDDRCYETWEELSEAAKFADCAVVSTQDQLHVEPAVAMARKGYHILLEKPMAVREEDCRTIYEEAMKAGVILAVCHVLRYYPPVRKLKELINAGVIGEVVNINHTEPVGFYHFAHSFVRGNWRKTSLSTFSLLAKCCHDVDLVLYLMGNNKECTRLSSFGSLHHFRKENKPLGGGSRCLECKVESTCPYSAKKIYLDSCPTKPSWPTSAVCDIEDSPHGYLHELTQAVRNGPYGKCVYESDNDVCDNQVVNFEFSDGATATLTMIAFTKNLCTRKAEVYGTRGQLVWDEARGGHVDHYDFLTRTTKIYSFEEDIQEVPESWGHGGADFFLMEAFVKAVASGDRKHIISGPRESLQTHLLAFAAEESRVKGEVMCPEQDPRWAV
ncbi:hypothetical protein Pcinc_022815 [Petrolisthes cinctipes]|uniref:Streptomycin biosynthesis protein StrI n=1 Tax=Petrolisthes cinctipes TaxID=88211 RepID=A0AAE1KFB9_PETCI|nr:hypothetical protein Pcinc_022815 [Petrolisthes cinctipes]